jgi:copper chaperone CopZ
MHNKIKNQILFLAVFLLLSTFAFSSQNEQVKILTNAHCGNCKIKIEKALKKVSGVEEANLDLTSKVAEVKYNPSQTNPETLVKAVQNAGYEASIYKEGSENNALPEHKDEHCKDKKKDDCSKDGTTKGKCCDTKTKK